MCTYCEQRDVDDNVSQCKDLFDTPVECGEGDDPAAVHCSVCTKDPVDTACNIGWLGYLSSDDFKTYMSAGGGGDEEPTESASDLTNMQITTPNFCDDGYTEDESIACRRSQLLAYCINATTIECCSGNTVAFNGSCPTSDEIEDYATRLQEFAQLYTMPSGWPYAEGPAPAPAPAPRPAPPQPSPSPPVPVSVITGNDADIHGCGASAGSRRNARPARSAGKRTSTAASSLRERPGARPRASASFRTSRASHRRRRLHPSR